LCWTSYPATVVIWSLNYAKMKPREGDGGAQSGAHSVVQRVEFGCLSWIVFLGEAEPVSVAQVSLGMEPPLLV
jgi:hypothetical protein